MSTHSKLAPSASKRWMDCTRSVSFIDELADEGKIKLGGTSSYAEEGTLAHEFASEILEGKMELDDIPFHPSVLESDYDSDEMCEAVGSYVNLAKRLVKDGDKVLIESSVPLFYKPEDTGTVDYALVSEKSVQILDLKYGKGVEVDAKDNSQLAIYAMSLIEDLWSEIDFTPDTAVIISIHQPRTRGDNPTRVWSLDLGELIEFCKPITSAVADITEGYDLAFYPNPDGCQFCPAKGVCSARAEYATNNFSHASIEAVSKLTDVKTQPTEKFVGPDIESLTDKQIATVVNHGKALIKWVNSITDDAKERILKGVKVDGLKIVNGNRGQRKWTNEEEADKLIKTKIKAEERYTKKLISLAQAEKLLKGTKLSTRFNNRFLELTDRKPGSPILVAGDDDRESITTEITDNFENI
tara:strand:+ start:1798 stop:3033 length:1236 start_codon:yes stop_codon:yes gene_type:complete